MKRHKGLGQIRKAIRFNNLKKKGPHGVCKCWVHIGAGLAVIGDALWSFGNRFGKPLVYISFKIIIFAVLAMLFRPLARILAAVAVLAVRGRKALGAVCREIYLLSCFCLGPVAEYGLNRITGGVLGYKRDAPDGGPVHLRKRRFFYVLTIHSEDGPNLLAKVARALARSGMNIRCGIAFTDSGVALGTFYFTDPKRKFDRNPTDIDRLVEAMRGVVSEMHSPVRMVGKSTTPHSQRPRVHVACTKAATKFAVIKITTHDRSHLLHQLSSAIAAQRYNIEIALIMTLGQKAIDSFHLSKW